jgi:hypothetical protein
MMNRYLRVIVAVVAVLGIVLLTRGGTAGAEDSASGSVVTRGDAPLESAGQEPGSVKPPPPVLIACAKGLYSVGGVVVIDIKEFEPGYCIQAELSNPAFPPYPIQGEAGGALAHLLWLRVYHRGALAYEVLPEDGSIEACYALPPEKQAQFHFYDYYWKRFETRTEPPFLWDPLETLLDTEKKTACAFTQVSGFYGLIGK